MLSKKKKQIGALKNNGIDKVQNYRMKRKEYVENNKKIQLQEFDKDVKILLGETNIDQKVDEINEELDEDLRDFGN